MPITSADLKWYGSAIMPDDDTVTNIGGAIDTSKKIEFTDISPADTVQVHSTAAGDTTQTVTITGRNPAGELVSEALALNSTDGTVWVSGSQTFERILKVVISAAHTGTIEVRETTSAEVIVTMEPGILEVRRLFYAALAEESGGATRNYYEKIFVKNEHSSLTLTSSVISEQADPSGVCAFALEGTLDGTDTNGAGNNRQVAPAGYTFDSTAKNVANSQNLTAGSAQGIWMQLTLAAGTSPAKTSVTMRITGNTT